VAGAVPGSRSSCGAAGGFRLVIVRIDGCSGSRRVHSVASGTWGISLCSPFSCQAEGAGLRTGIASSLSRPPSAPCSWLTCYHWVSHIGNEVQEQEMMLSVCGKGTAAQQHHAPSTQLQALLVKVQEGVGNLARGGRCSASC
jgi:hypothetical protein